MLCWVVLVLCCVSVVMYWYGVSVVMSYGVSVVMCYVVLVLCCALLLYCAMLC